MYVMVRLTRGTMYEYAPTQVCLLVVQAQGFLIWWADGPDALLLGVVPVVVCEDVNARHSSPGWELIEDGAVFELHPRQVFYVS